MVDIGCLPDCFFSVQELCSLPCGSGQTAIHGAILPAPGSHVTQAWPIMEHCLSVHSDGSQSRANPSVTCATRTLEVEFYLCVRVNDFKDHRRLNI